MRVGLATPPVAAPSKAAAPALSDLAPKIAASPEIASFVVEVLTKRREGPLGQLLREDRAVRFQPEPAEAAGLVLAELQRSGVNGIRARGPDGAKLAALIESAQGTPSAAMLQQVVEAGINSVPWMQQQQLRDAMMPPVAKPAAIAPAQTKATPVRFEQLLPALSYAPGATLKSLRDAVNAVPPTALGSEVAKSSRGTDDASLLAGYIIALDQHPELALPMASFTQPERPDYADMAKIVDAISMRLGPAQAKPLIDKLVRPALIPSSLAPLDAVLKLTPDGALTGKGLVAAQHLFPNTVPLLEACIAKGMNPRDIVVHGSPYNNNPLVVSYLRLLGMDVHPGKDNLGATRALKEEKLQELEDLVGRISTRSPPPNGWVVLDDGGLLQKVISGTEQSTYGKNKPDPKLLAKAFPPEKTLAVEQTTRGLTEVGTPRMHTIAVARAEGKKLEGDVIGWALGESALQEMLQRGMNPKKTKLALVGAGTAGFSAATYLKQIGVEPIIVDPNPVVREKAKALGFQAFATQGEALDQVQVALSVTGRNVWDGETVKNWNGLLLSGSSMAAEFDVDQLNAYRNTPMQIGNRGRPVNFAGDGFAVLDPKEIGITLGLLFQGVSMPLPDGPPALHDVDEPRQQAAIAAWKETRGAPRKLTVKEPPAPAPDSLAPDGKASHNAWMSYLSSLRRPVFPPPNSVGHQVPIYFFQDELGAVRMVDTRVGSSKSVELPSVPKEVTPLSREGTSYLLQLEGEAWRMDQNGLTKLGDVDKQVGTYVRDEGARGVTVGIALQGKDGVYVLPPGGSTLEKHALPLSGDSLFAWTNRSEMLQIQKKPAAIKAIPVGPDKPIVPWRTPLPKEMVEVEAVARYGQYDAVVIGKDAKGTPVLSALSDWARMGHENLKTLPEGATLRGIRPSGEGLRSRYIVDYTLPGDPVELSAYRKQVVDFMEDIPGIH